MTETLTPQRTRKPSKPPVRPDRPPRKVTVADVLERAADLLGEFGWIQHTPGSKTVGQMCAAGAIEEAAADLGLNRREWAVRARGWGGDIDPTLVDFNDARGRTKAEVISALRAAASSARTKEED